MTREELFIVEKLMRGGRVFMPTKAFRANGNGVPARVSNAEADRTLICCCPADLSNCGLTFAVTPSDLVKLRTRRELLVISARCQTSRPKHFQLVAEHKTYSVYRDTSIPEEESKREAKRHRPFLYTRDRRQR